MARKTITTYVSDISGSEIKDESEAVEVRIKFLGSSKRNPVRLDALASEVQNLIEAGEEFSPPGRKASAK